MTDKKQPSKNNKTTAKKTVKKPAKKPPASVNKGGRPTGPMSDRAKYIRDTRDGVRKLKKITQAHLNAALTDLDTAKTVCTLIRATHELNTCLYKDHEANNVAVAVQINNNGEKTNTEEVLKILQKKHKEIKND